MSESELISKLDSSQGIILYGAGYVGKLLLKRLLENGIRKERLSFFVSGCEHPESYLGVPIYTIGERPVEGKTVVISVLPNKHEELECRLRDIYGSVPVLKIDAALAEEMKEHRRLRFRIADHDTMPVDVLYMASDNYASSGAFRCMVDLNSELQKQGVKTLIVLPIIQPEYEDGEALLAEAGLPYTFVESKHWFTETGECVLPDNETAICELERLIRQKSIRLVHNNTIYTYVGAVAAKRCGIPYVWHIRENIFWERWEFCNESYAMQLMNEASTLIAPSKYIVNSYPGLDREKFNIVCDGVDTSKFLANRKEILKEETINLICVGGIRPLKGQADIISAAGILKKRGISFRLRLLGMIDDEDYFCRLLHLIDAANMDENCIFCGNQSEIGAFYDISDVVIVCSCSEAFGRVTVEGLLKGLVVIGANCGATSELLKNHPRGLLYEQGNADELAEKIVEIVANREAYAKIDFDVISSAVREFSKGKNAEQVVEQYNRIFITQGTRGETV